MRDSATTESELWHSAENFVLHVMKITEFREGESIGLLLAATCDHAIQNMDWQFFIRLGRALDDPVSVKELFDDPISNFILAGWENIDHNIGLKDLSDEAITEYATIHLKPCEPFTLDQVRQIRYRMGFEKNLNPRFTKVEETANGVRIS
jgi:hypothetical protein